MSFSWYLDGVQVGQGATLVPNATGEYLLTATNGSCTLFAQPFPWPAGLGDGDGGVAGVANPTPPAPVLSVVPNPASGPVVIMGAGEGDLTVVDPNGRICFAAYGVQLPFALDTDTWSGGLYAVSVHNAEGQRSARFVLRP